MLFAVFGLLSEGTHNDDDIGRYLNVRAAFEFPEQFLSRWNRPGFVLLYAVPAQFGYWAVELLTALLSALTCYFVYRTARKLREDNPGMAVILTAFQPFFFALSYSALTEPLAAFLVSASLYLLYSRRHLASAVLAAAIPLARLELSVIFLPWAVRYVRERSWTSIIVLPVGVLAWNVAGFLTTGDILYLFHQVFTGAERIYTGIGLLHYLTGYIFIVGPVVFALSLVGLVDSVRRRQLPLIWVSVLIMLVTYTWLSSVSSAGQAAGFLRHFVAISPFLALLALRGFNLWFKKKPSIITILVLLASSALCWFFLSRKMPLNYITLGEEPEYLKFGTIVVLTVIAILSRLVPVFFASRAVRICLPLLLVLLCMVYNFRENEIIHLSPERETMKRIAAWYREEGLQDRVTLCNHIWFHFFSNTNRLQQDKYPVLNKQGLDAAPLGSIAIWDGHYSHRLSGDVGLSYMEENRNYQVLRRFIDSELHFFAVVLEKTSDGERGEGILTKQGYHHPGLGVRWEFQNGRFWALDLVEKEVELIRGWHPNGATLRVGLERFFRLIDASNYTKQVQAQLAKRPGITVVGAETRGPWYWIWAKRQEQGFVVCMTVHEEKLTVLEVVCSYPPGGENWARSEMEGLLKGLRFEPAEPGRAR